MQAVYLISGPLGAGKTTLAAELTKLISNSKLIAGDDFLSATEHSNLTWEERLEDAWQKILALTKSYLRDGFDVVIDFVVEEELAWFGKHISMNKINLKYIVLLADKKTIRSRLEKRNHWKDYGKRSLFLLNKLSSKPSNQNFIYNTSNEAPIFIAKEFISSEQYIVKGRL